MRIRTYRAAFALIAGAVLLVISSPAISLTPLEIQKLLASDTANLDVFGSSVGMSRDAVVIGAPSNVSDAAGAAYIYARVRGGDWYEQAKLSASDGTPDDNFGISVAIEGNTVLVGNPTAQGSGHVFIQGEDGSWSEQAILVGNDAAVMDAFGISVAIDGDTALIGANQADSNGLEDSGAAYVFTRDSSGSWSEQAKLLPGDAGSLDEFGSAVAVDGDTLVIGAPSRNHLMTGAAYVFRRDTFGIWTEEAKLLSSEGAGDDAFGNAVAVDNNTVVIGAHHADRFAPENTGAAYVFKRKDSGNWFQQARLRRSGRTVNDEFGISVALQGDTAIVGALRPNSHGGHGAAYIYTRTPSGSWSERALLSASDGGTGDQFGYAVAIGGDTTVIGARLSEEGGLDSGSAYIFRIERPGPLIRCPGDINADGVGDVAVIRSTGKVIVKDLNNRLVNRFSFTELEEVVDVEWMPDANANGAAELVALGSAKTEIRDSLTGAKLSVIDFDSGTAPVDLELVPDQTGNGFPELAILGEGPVVKVALKDGLSGQPINTLRYWGTRPLDLEIYPDLNGNGSPELAVLLAASDAANGSDMLQIRDLATGDIVQTLWYSSDYSHLQQALVADMNGNGTPEAATVRQNKYTDRINVTIRDPLGDVGIGVNPIIGFDPNYPPTHFFTIADINGNGADEVVAFGRRFNLGNQKAKIRDSMTKEVISHVFFDKSYAMKDLTTCPDLNGNGADELAFLGENEVIDYQRAIIKDMKTAERLGTASFPCCR